MGLSQTLPHVPLLSADVILCPFTINQTLSMTAFLIFVSPSRKLWKLWTVLENPPISIVSHRFAVICWCVSFPP